QIAHVSSVKVPVLSPSSIPTIWEEIQDLTGPRNYNSNIRIFFQHRGRCKCLSNVIINLLYALRTLYAN
ncbi:hypothetical protein FKW50_09300, partial [Acetobacter pomorum]